jgi:type IV pilus assembly protein PilM
MANVPLKQPGVWGIDLGQCALKAIRLEEVDGQIKATAFDYIEHPKILSQPDADPDQLTREALEKFLSRNDLKGDTVAISVPGQSGLARFVKLPPVDEKKIPDIVRFEAKQQIPFPLEEVVWAFQRLGSGMVTDNMVLDAEIGLFAMKRDMVNRYLQHFKDVNVEVHYIQMAPLALCNFLAHDLLGKGQMKEAAGDEEEEKTSGDKSCVVALDIGADNSNLVITDGEKIIWQRPIPLGGNHFTRALTKDLKLTFAKAEHLKRNAVKSPDLKKILAALKPVLNDFVSEVQRSLGYFTNTHRDANIMFMVGLGNAFRLPGLQKYLQEKLQLEVRKLQKIERLQGEESVTEAPQYVENVLSFAVAHGLALQGLNATRVHTNLLPPEISQQRFIRAKKPWAVAAAAVLLLLAPPLLIGYAANQSAWTNKQVVDARAKLKTAKDAAAKDVGDFNAATEQAKEAKRKVLAMSGGITERLNWIHLNAFIDESLPQPDDGYTGPSGKDPQRLGKPTREGFDAWSHYWEGSKGIARDYYPGFQTWKDYVELRNKLAKGVMPTPEDLQKEEAIKKYLIKVNIEGVVAMYCDDLPKEYFARLIGETNKDKTPSKLIGLSAEDGKNIREKNADKLPKAGWVVEIRGFTYHQDADRFIRNTILENLRDLAETEKANLTIPKAIFPPEASKALRTEVGEAAEGGKKAEKSLASYVQLYEYYIDYNPAPGQFELIRQSRLPEVLGVTASTSGQGPAGVSKAGMMKPNMGKDDAGAQEGDKSGKDRSNWHPAAGTLAADSFGGVAGGGSGPGGIPGGVGTPSGAPGLSATGARPGVKFGASAPRPPVEAPGNPNVRRQQRTEFVILFIWQEPVAEDPAPPAGQ